MGIRGSTIQATFTQTVLLVTNLDTRFVEQLHLDDHYSALVFVAQSFEIISVLARPSTGHDFRVWQRQDLQQTQHRDDSIITELALHSNAAEPKVLTRVQNSRPMPLVAPVTAQTVLTATMVKMRSMPLCGKWGAGRRAQECSQMLDMIVERRSCVSAAQ